MPITSPPPLLFVHTRLPLTSGQSGRCVVSIRLKVRVPASPAYVAWPVTLTWLRMPGRVKLWKTLLPA